MWQYAENSRTPLSEVEAFCGSILNKRGSQTRRQRDSSIKLKEEVDRMMSWVAELIRDRGSEGSNVQPPSSLDGKEDAAEEDSRKREAVIQLCLACVTIGSTNDTRVGNVTRHREPTTSLVSFRVLAACCLLREFNALKRTTAEKTGGGFVGVSGGGGRRTTLPFR